MSAPREDDFPWLRRVRSKGREPLTGDEAKDRAIMAREHVAGFCRHPYPSDLDKIPNGQTISWQWEDGFPLPTFAGSCTYFMPGTPPVQRAAARVVYLREHGCVGLSFISRVLIRSARIAQEAKKAKERTIPIKDVSGRVVGEGAFRVEGDRVLFDGVIRATPDAPALVDPDKLADDARHAALDGCAHRTIHEPAGYVCTACAQRAARPDA